MKRDHGISETISVILIIAMVVILAFVVALSLMGFNFFQQKSAYISADINKQTLSSGKEVISVFNRGGDTAYMNATGQQQYQMSVYVDDTTMGSVQVQPTSGVDKFSPGSTFFIYYNSSSGYDITDNPANLGAADQSLPGSLTGVRLVDGRSEILIAEWGGSTGGNQTLSIVSIAPNSGYNTLSVPITDLIGTGFSTGATVKLNRTSAPDISATSVNIVSSTKISCTFNLNGVTNGSYNVVVTNSGGQSAMLTGGFTVKPAGPAPTVTSITNTTGYRGRTVIERITGTNFVSGATSKLNRTGSADIPADTCTFSSATQLICTYNLLGKNVSPPNYNVVVTNPDGKSGMRANYFILSSPNPTISSSTPATGAQATTVSITNLAGTYFQPSATAVYRQGAYSIPLTGINVVSATSITGTLVIPSSAPSGAYNVTVTNTDGKTGTRASTFTVTSNAPTVTSITNTTGYRGRTVIERITGTNFVSSATSKLNRTGSADIPADTCTFSSATQLICTYNLLGQTASPPNYNVVVTNPDGKSGMRANYFILSSPNPTISGSTPATGAQATTVSITNLAGNYFQPGATAVYSQGAYSIPLTGINVVSATSITGTLVIPSLAPAGAYNITVTNTDGKIGTRTSGFTVTSNAPTVTSITPNTYVRGWTVSITNLAGTKFQPGAIVKLVNSTVGPDITATNVVINPGGTSLTCTFDLTGAPAARRSVTVTNPDGKVGTLANGFTITGNAPTLTARNPTAGNRGWPVNIITLTGTGFQPGAGVRLQRSGYSDIVATGVNVASPTSINVGTFDLLGVTAGAWTIRVINADGGSSGTQAFTVSSPTPTISSVTPNTAALGTTVSITNLAGNYFQPGATVQLRNTTTVISTGTSVNVALPNQITCQFTIPSSGVRTGANAYYIRVINTDAVTGNSGSIFSIT